MIWLSLECHSRVICRIVRLIKRSILTVRRYRRRQSTLLGGELRPGKGRYRRNTLVSLTVRSFEILSSPLPTWSLQRFTSTKLHLHTLANMADSAPVKRKAESDARSNGDSKRSKVKSLRRAPTCINPCILDPNLHAYDLTGTQ